MGKENRVTHILYAVVAAVLMLLPLSSLSALERKGNITLYVLLDRSLSMKQEIDEVKQYVDRDLIRDTLIPGDSIVLIEFFRIPRVVFSETIESNDDKDRILSRIRSIEADGPYTDIGKALDRLVEGPEGWDLRYERSHTLLLSDLIQEAPVGSPYVGTRKNFSSHPLLSPKKEIERNGWKICVIGPDVDETAEKMAGEVVSARSSAD